MPQKFIVFFGISGIYRTSKGAMYDTVDGRNSCLILAVRFSLLTCRLARGDSGKEVNIFWEISSLTLVKTLVNLQIIRTRKAAAEVAMRNRSSSLSYMILCVNA